MGDVIIGNAWGGLNRLVAPHLLSEKESPDCRDCAPFDDIVGLLGPRRGRQKVYNRDALIMGVGLFVTPRERIRMVATDDGVWHPENLVWPSLEASDFLGWDKVDIDTLAASRSGGAGTTNGTAKTLSEPLDLSIYEKILILDEDYYPHDIAGDSEDFVVKFQGYIDSVWTDIFKITREPAGDFYPQQVLASSNGELTQVRAVVTTNDANSVDVTFNMDLYLLSGSQRKQVTIS